MIQLRYKCSCMQDEGSFMFRERDPGEDILDYMQDVQFALGNNHRVRSPMCTASAVEYLKMPVEEGKPIGQVSDAH